MEPPSSFLWRQSSNHYAATVPPSRPKRPTNSHSNSGAAFTFLLPVRHYHHLQQRAGRQKGKERNRAPFFPSFYSLPLPRAPGLGSGEVGFFSKALTFFFPSFPATTTTRAILCLPPPLFLPLLWLRFPLLSSLLPSPPAPQPQIHRPTDTESTHENTSFMKETRVNSDLMTTNFAVVTFVHILSFAPNCLCQGGGGGGRRAFFSLQPFLYGRGVAHAKLQFSALHFPPPPPFPLSVVTRVARYCPPGFD